MDIATQSFVSAVIEEIFGLAEKGWGATVVIEYFSDVVVGSHLQQCHKPQKAGPKDQELVMSYKRDLLTAVFNPKREGHDGAVIIQLFDGTDFAPR